jgi:antitoxin HicB
MRYAYPARLKRYPDTIIVTFRDFPEALTEGKDRDDALASAVDCLDVCLLFRVKDGEVIPAPSAPKRGEVLIPASPQVAAKVAFVLAFRASGLTRVALAKRLGWAESEIRRLLDPNHATKLDRIDVALRALGRRLVVGDAPLAA